VFTCIDLPGTSIERETLHITMANRPEVELCTWRCSKLPAASRSAIPSDPHYLSEMVRQPLRLIAHEFTVDRRWGVSTIPYRHQESFIGEEEKPSSKVLAARLTPTTTEDRPQISQPRPVEYCPGDLRAVVLRVSRRV
jgi:hypothetical protein